MDAGEALISQRSEKVWSGIRLDREVTESGRRALVRRTAQRSGCAVLLTEDLQDGRVFDGVEVVNPFRALTKPRGR